MRGKIFRSICIFLSTFFTINVFSSCGKIKDNTLPVTTANSIKSSVETMLEESINTSEDNIVNSDASNVSDILVDTSTISSDISSMSTYSSLEYNDFITLICNTYSCEPEEVSVYFGKDDNDDELIVEVYYDGEDAFDHIDTDLCILYKEFASEKLAKEYYEMYAPFFDTGDYVGKMDIGDYYMIMDAEIIWGDEFDPEYYYGGLWVKDDVFVTILTGSEKTKEVEKVDNLILGIGSLTPKDI